MLVQEIALSHAILQRREYRGSILNGFGVFTNDPRVPVTKAIRIVGLEGDSMIVANEAIEILFKALKELLGFGNSITILLGLSRVITILQLIIHGGNGSSCGWILFESTHEGEYRTEVLQVGVGRPHLFGFLVNGLEIFLLKCGLLKCDLSFGCVAFAPIMFGGLLYNGNTIGTV